MDSKVVHDLLMAVKPDDAVHDSVSCQFCQETSGQTVTSTDQGGVLNVSEITQTDIDRAVSEAVAPLNEELAALRKFKVDIESSEAAQAVEEKIAAAEAKAADLQEQLDAAEIKATEAQTQYEQLLAWLQEEAVKAEEAERIEALRVERVAAVKALKIFSEDYVEANAGRYAEMDEAAFESAVEDWKAIAAARTETDDTEEETLPKSTVFTATRDDDGQSKSNLSLIRQFRSEGVDLRRVR